MQDEHQAGPSTPADEVPRYVGPDRRRPVTDGDLKPYLGRSVLAAVGVVSVWGLLLVLSSRQPAATRQALIDMDRALVAALLLAAAALRFATWRITGTARAAWSVIVLAVAGLATPVVGMITVLPGDMIAGADRAAIARGMVQITLICLGAVMVMSPAVVSRLKPLRMAAPFVAGCLVVAAAITIRGPAGTSSPMLSVTAEVVRWTVAVLWIGLAVAFVAVGTVRRRYSDRVVGYLLFLPALGLVAEAVLGPLPYQRMVLPAAVQLFVAVLLAGVSAAALWRVQTGRGTRLLTVSGELHGTRLSLDHLRREHARRVHDARSAILAVSGATSLLARREQPDGVDPLELHRLVSAELHRLDSLLDPRFRGAVRSFRPADVIEPLVLAHRLDGAHIETEIADYLAVGQPEATATAIANVLSNARTHAPGAHIWVTLTADEGTVQVRIADDGPGIRPAERPLVVQEGVRGSAAGAGSGIGLATATQAMSDQGGTLAISDRPGGGTMITLTLRRERRRTSQNPHLPGQCTTPEHAQHPRYTRPSRRKVTAVHGRVGASS